MNHLTQLNGKNGGKIIQETQHPAEENNGETTYKAIKTHIMKHHNNKIGLQIILPMRHNSNNGEKIMQEILPSNSNGERRILETLLESQMVNGGSLTKIHHQQFFLPH